MTTKQAILWQIQDDKPGHQNQLLGLVNALAELLPLEVHLLRAPSRRHCFASLWSKQFPAGSHLPAPDLILGAGHATHLAVLAARRSFGGRAVVLMKPSLPPALFDLCLIPEHDRVAASDKVVTTRGVLNVIRPTKQHDEKSGLLLIGGPSAAHGWSDEQMFAQIVAITSGDASIRWKLTTSRRTPQSFVSKLAFMSKLPVLSTGTFAAGRAGSTIANLEVVPHAETTAQWVPQQLAKAAQVWVSEDSVSMVYEALTSGAAVGVLAVPEHRHGRVAAGMKTLIKTGWATRFADWQPGSRLAPPPAQLDEARRCAEIVFRSLRAQAAA